MTSAGAPTSTSERDEWRAVAFPLGVLVVLFGAGWWYTARATGVSLGWPVAIPYGIALGWLARALLGWAQGSRSAMDRGTLAQFRDRQFWSRPARWSYAAVLVCDGLFLLDLEPEAPALFLVFAALAGVFAIEVGVLSVVLGVFQLL